MYISTWFLVVSSSDSSYFSVPAEVDVESSNYIIMMWTCNQAIANRWLSPRLRLDFIYLLWLWCVIGVFSPLPPPSLCRNVVLTLKMMRIKEKFTAQQAYCTHRWSRVCVCFQFGIFNHRHFVKWVTCEREPPPYASLLLTDRNVISFVCVSMSHVCCYNSLIFFFRFATHWHRIIGPSNTAIYTSSRPQLKINKELKNNQSNQ